MSDYIIKVENLGKKYRIRHEQRERYTALRDVLARKATAPLRWFRKHGAWSMEQQIVLPAPRSLLQAPRSRLAAPSS